MPRFLLVGLLALTAVGCGEAGEGGQPTRAAEEPSVSVGEPPSGPPLTRGEYFRAVREIVEGPAAEATPLFDALVAGELTAEECAKTARQFGHALDRIVDRAAALSPPAHVAELHGRFVAAAREAVTDVKPTLAKAQSGELACGEPINEAIYGLPATAAAERLLSRIEGKGYVIFGE